MEVRNNGDLNFEWLRENCRCPDCYNVTTNQRNIQLYNIPQDVKPRSHCIIDNVLRITWDDGHESEYPIDWLMQQRKCEVRPEEVLWTGDMTDKVEHNLKATQDVVECLGPPRHTIFGSMWKFNDQMDHADTAYTNLGLDAHTDTTYFIEPAGLIIFHCIQRECQGGKTSLVDGFRAAQQVKMEVPDLYKCLTTVKTEFQYIDSKKGYHLTALTPMLQHWSDNRLAQIRYNLYDRSSRLPQPESTSGEFYRALRHLDTAVRKPEAVWWLTLQPGTVVFINNWRVLHGRSAYTGRRTMTGAYMAMDTLLSRARFLKLIL